MGFLSGKSLSRSFSRSSGRRWVRSADGTRKIWYICDVKDRTLFLRWIPDMATAGSAIEPVRPTTKSEAVKDRRTVGAPSAPLAFVNRDALVALRTTLDEFLGS